MTRSMSSGASPSVEMASTIGVRVKRIVAWSSAGRCSARPVSIEHGGVGVPDDPRVDDDSLAGCDLVRQEEASDEHPGHGRVGHRRIIPAPDARRGRARGLGQQELDEAGGRLVRRHRIGVDDVVGDRGVQRLPFEERGRHPRPWVRVEPRAMFGSRGSCREVVRARTKPDDDPAAPQRLAVGGVEDHPSSHADDRRGWKGDARRQRLRLRPAHRGLAAFREKRARRRPVCAEHELVVIRVRPAGGIGEEAADRRLAAPHHPDQQDPAWPVDRHPGRRSSSSSQASSRGVCSA